MHPGALCPCCGKAHDLGRAMNTRASVGAEIATLRERIPHLEKVSKKTPPKHLTSARKLVEDAKVALEVCKKRLPEAESEYQELCQLEAELYAQRRKMS